MEWRCEWCGKPHESDDPPCDNCGHGSFERAVVREGPGGEGSATTTVWVCQECGRAHPKNSPPCSRCGNGTLELEERSVEDYEDIGAPGYRDLVTTRYAVGLVLALALLAVFVAGVTGLVTVPGLTPTTPTVEDVPGNDTQYEGLELAAVESEFLAALDDERREAGVAPLTRNPTLDEIAAFLNRRRVKAAYGSGSVPPRDAVFDRVKDTCSGNPYVVAYRPAGLPSLERFATAGDAGEALAGQATIKNREFGSETDLETGVDLHVAPDGSTYLYQIVC